MRIGIDIRSLQEEDRFRGIGAYLTNLVRELAHIDDHNDYVLYAWHDQAQLTALGFPSRFRVRLKPLGRPPRYVAISRSKNCLWRDLRVSRRDVDVFLQPNTMYGLPWGNAPTVAVAYDLIPLIFRDRYLTIPSLGQVGAMGLRPLLRQMLHAWIYRWSVRQLASATRILAISDTTKRDLLRYFPRLQGKVTVTHLACDPHFRPRNATGSVLAKFGIDRPFLLYVGGVDFRKNVAALLDSYDHLRTEGRDLQLVLVGREFALGHDATPDLFSLRRRMAASRYSTDIKRAGFVDREDLAGLYSAALAFVFPSLYEGFGLPILEAMACGCPVIAYRTSSIPEVVGTAAVLVDLSEDLTPAVTRLIGDEPARQRLIAAGFGQVEKFSWERTAARTLKVLQETAAEAS